MSGTRAKTLQMRKNMVCALKTQNLSLRVSALHLRTTVSTVAEERLVTLGLLDARLVVIVHAPFDDGTRIISMRKGTRNEGKIYQERFEAD
jgi:uncharacterized DUF497 family protein